MNNYTSKIDLSDVNDISNCVAKIKLQEDVLYQIRVHMYLDKEIDKELLHILDQNTDFFDTIKRYFTKDEILTLLKLNHQLMEYFI